MSSDNIGMPPCQDFTFPHPNRDSLATTPTTSSMLNRALGAPSSSELSPHILRIRTPTCHRMTQSLTGGGASSSTPEQGHAEDL
jgi:hypothetical protein